MNLLIFSACGEGLIFAHKLREEGHDVIAYIESKDHKRIYDGIVWKTDDPDSIADQADIIWFDDNGLGEKADAYRKKGHLVWGGGQFVDRLEHDRLYGQKVFTDHGIPTPDTFEVKSLADVKSCLASEFKGEKKAVIKVSGEDGAGTSLSFVAKSLDQIEEQVEHWEADGVLPKKWVGILQKFVEGIEVSCAAFWDGEKFDSHYITLEEKKQLTGNLGPNVGCAFNTVFRIKPSSRLFKQMLEPIGPTLKKHGYMGEIDTNSIVGADGVPRALEWTPRCYSDDTEVLTHSGWRPMRDVRVGDSVAILGDDHGLGFAPVSQTVRKRVDGNMVAVKSENCYDLLVTPDHQMVFQDKDGRLYSQEVEKVKGFARTKRTAVWRGLHAENYTIPAYTETHATGRHKGSFKINHPEISMSMMAWMRFLGLFIAEGNCHRGKGAPYGVQITQFNRVAECAEILKATGLPFKRTKHGFMLYSVQVGAHLDSLVGTKKAPEKRVPRFVMELAPAFCEEFLNGFHVGDGSTHKRSGQRTYVTSSPGLADDLGELLLRTGIWYRIVKRSPGGYSGKCVMYCVSERRVKADGRLFATRHLKRVEYHGEVVCLTVPFHRLYVRRPGGPSLWCGNCGYESTPTMAYLHGCDGPLGPLGAPGEALGKFGAAMRLYIPPYCFESKSEKLMAQANETCCGVPIQGHEAVKDRVWLYDAMIGEHGLCCAGTSGMIGAAFGAGETVRDAGIAAYKAAERLVVPNIGYRAIDGFRRAADAVPELISMGLIRL